MPKDPQPRNANYYGMRSTASHFALSTWLEPEELTYPSGGMLRRARAINRDTGRLQVVRCGIPDTYFTIVASGGYLDITDGNILRFNPSKVKAKS